MRPAPLTPGQHALFLRYTPYAVGVARRFYAVIPEDHDGLRQEALLALVKAVRSYDPARGKPFESHACLRIGGAVLDACRKQHFMGRRGFQRVRQELEREVMLVSLDTMGGIDPAVNGRHAPLLDTGPPPDDEAAARELWEDCVGGLSRADQRLLEERFIRGKPLRQLARRRRVSPQALRLRLRGIRDRLRGVLQRAGVAV